ncbi:MAG: glycosyltransferase family 4 protein [Candidatus Thiodiazotropha sp.]
MNICFVYDCEYPWDVRVEKIINSLYDHGHTVTLVARNKKREPRFSQQQKCDIYRLPSSNNKVLNGIFNITLFFNPIWIRNIFKVSRDTGSDVIIVRDLPLSGAAVFIGWLRKIPVIVDMAEPYPLTVRQRRFFEPFKLSHLITRNIAFSDLYEKVVLKFASHIFVVCEEAKNRLKNLGARSESVSIVHNTPDLKKFDNSLPDEKESYFNTSEYVILYTGILIGGRGLEIAINAMSQVKTKNTSVKLYIIGSGKAEHDLKKQVSDLDLDDTVYFLGWIDNDLLPGYINNCDVGILPFSNTQHINNTIANKLFDFMAMSKSVICSDVDPMYRIINQENCGYTFKADDAISLAEVIMQSFNDTSKNKLGENGYTSVVKKYNWSSDEKTLVSSVESFFES